MILHWLSNRIQREKYLLSKCSVGFVAKALYKANGICEACHQPAPFIKKSNGQPYLEVHHIKSLSDGGKDSLENVQAICPNCHREMHFG
ncbi:HNH endonuclease signature motif containing protein [Photobacterium aquimaris]|uniref:HNH endonuclease n=1 Tax=Photobacterium aquimaris TaxID=512643 RepID=UPI0009EEB4BF|nr:HNH endonuclease signature motif containing protein [Photobacterium aquimaris]PSW01246.1 HNH endonuclease [Photobacterium aquimaris]